MRLELTFFDYTQNASGMLVRYPSVRKIERKDGLYLMVWAGGPGEDSKSYRHTLKELSDIRMTVHDPS